MSIFDILVQYYDTDISVLYKKKRKKSTNKQANHWGLIMSSLSC